MTEQALLISDSVNQNAFLYFLEFVLWPTLTEGSVLVMDNWSVHHGEVVRDLAERFGCELLYLPTYSPDFNPIEHLFTQLKMFVKALRPNTSDTLTAVFGEALTAVSPQNVRNSYRHCGYLEAQ